MPMLAPLVLSSVILAAASGPPGDESPEPRTDMLVWSSAASLLGAASACDQIAHARVSAAAGEVGALATASAISVEEVTSIHRVLMASAAAGWQALKDGKTDCKKVEASFNELEQAVLQTPVALRSD